jgi:hypothetical protein
MHPNDERSEDGRNFDEAGQTSAVQSGDMQGISNEAGADSESVEELLEEGNSYEAEVVEGVENARDADVSEVTTRQVPEQDVPEEYRNDGGKVA